MAWMDAWTYLHEGLFHRRPRPRRLPEAHVVGQRPGAVTLGTSPPRLRARNPASRGRRGRARRDSTREPQADRPRILPLAIARPPTQPEPRRLRCLHSPRAGHAAFCRSSAARLRPRSPAARPSVARAPDLLRVPPARRGPAPHRARQPASRVPPRAAPQLAPRRPRHGPSPAPAPPARRPCHLAPPRAGPAPVGPERLGWPAPRRGGPKAGCWAGPGPPAAAEGL